MYFDVQNLKLKYATRGRNAIEDACVVDGRILVCHELNDFLRYQATSKGGDIGHLLVGEPNTNSKVRYSLYMCASVNIQVLYRPLAVFRREPCARLVIGNATLL